MHWRIRLRRFYCSFHFKTPATTWCRPYVSYMQMRKGEELSESGFLLSTLMNDWSWRQLASLIHWPQGWRDNGCRFIYCIGARTASLWDNYHIIKHHWVTLCYVLCIRFTQTCRLVLYRRKTSAHALQICGGPIVSERTGVQRRSTVRVVWRRQHVLRDSTCVYTWDTRGVEHALVLGWAHGDCVLEHELKRKKKKKGENQTQTDGTVTRKTKQRKNKIPRDESLAWHDTTGCMNGGGRREGARERRWEAGSGSSRDLRKLRWREEMSRSRNQWPSDSLAAAKPWSHSHLGSDVIQTLTTLCCVCLDRHTPKSKVWTPSTYDI